MNSWNFANADWNNPDTRDKRYFIALSEALKERASAVLFYQGADIDTSFLPSCENDRCLTTFPIVQYDNALRQIIPYYYNHNISVNTSKQKFIEANSEDLIQVDGSYWWHGGSSASGSTYDLVHWNLQTIADEAGLTEADTFTISARGFNYPDSDKLKNWIKTRKKIIDCLRWIRWKSESVSVQWDMASNEEDPATTRQYSKMDNVGFYVPPAYWEGSYPNYTVVLNGGDYNDQSETDEETTQDLSLEWESSYDYTEAYRFNPSPLDNYNTMDGMDGHHFSESSRYNTGSLDITVTGNGRTKAKIGRMKRTVESKDMIPRFSQEDENGYLNYLDIMLPSTTTDTYETVGTYDGGYVNGSKIVDSIEAGHKHVEQPTIDLKDLMVWPGGWNQDMYDYPYIYFGSGVSYFSIKGITGSQSKGYGLLPPDTPSNENWGVIVGIEGKYTSISNENFKFRDW